MKIHHIRNATMVLETHDKVILIDPMIGDKGAAGPPFSFIRSKPKRNPTVGLPDGAMELMEKTKHCLITHLHPDHLDKAAIAWLKENQKPVICSKVDEAALKKHGFNIIQTLEYWKPADFLGGKIIGVPALHGYGFVTKFTGEVMGFYIEFPNEPSVYLSSDTIYTDDVAKVFKEYKPAVSVVAAGSAQFDFFKPLLMTLEDIVRFIKDAPGKVIANHMEAVDHCTTTRAKLRKELTNQGLLDKTSIPNDGEAMNFNI